MAQLQWFEEIYLKYRHESPLWVRRRAAKFLAVLGEYVDRPFEAEELKDASKRLRALIPDRVARQVIDCELRAMAGLRWDWQTMARIACSLAGGYMAAREGLAMGVMASTWPSEDCLLRVKSVQRVQGPRADADMIELKFVACNSRFAGEIVTAEFLMKRLSNWGSLFGIGHRRAKIRCSNAKLFISCEVIGRLERLENTTQLVGVTCPVKLKQQNSRLTAKRFRKMAGCPFGATWDCLDCLVGVNQCERACVTDKTDYPLEAVK